MKKDSQTTIVISPPLPPTLLYGSGWRARWRKWRGKTRPVVLTIERGTDREEVVRVVGVQDGRLVIERQEWP